MYCTNDEVRYALSMAIADLAAYNASAIARDALIEAVAVAASATVKFTQDTVIPSAIAVAAEVWDCLEVAYRFYTSSEAISFYSRVLSGLRSLLIWAIALVSVCIKRLWRHYHPSSADTTDLVDEYLDSMDEVMASNEQTLETCRAIADILTEETTPIDPVFGDNLQVFRMPTMAEVQSMTCKELRAIAGHYDICRFSAKTKKAAMVDAVISHLTLQ